MARLKVFFMLLITALALGWCAAAQASLTYTPIPFDYNSVNWGRNSNYPTGNPVILGGLPFNIPSNPNLNTWDSNTGSYGSGNQTFDIPLHVYGAVEVNTLINTSWGYAGETHTWLTFTGSSGTTYTKSLENGVDIRDWNDGGYANSINGTTTTNVFYNGSSRVDKQQIILPDGFADEYLINIHVLDNGDYYYHRAFLYGVTVGANPVPLPPTVLLLGSGLLGLAGWRRIRKS